MIRTGYIVDNLIESVIRAIVNYFWGEFSRNPNFPRFREMRLRVCFGTPQSSNMGDGVLHMFKFRLLSLFSKTFIT